MANIITTDPDFLGFCYAVKFLVQEYYKDPANMEAFKKWQAEREKAVGKRSKESEA